jgi:hypothetical protein
MQGLRHFNQEKHQAMGEELSRLLATGFIKEVWHPDWTTNPVLVPKKNRNWRVCVDYTSRNKACPNDRFPLPRIDKVMDLTTRCEPLSFLDAYLRYHHIPHAEADQPTTTLITPFDLFCYVKMSFEIKNTGATYQQCM